MKRTALTIIAGLIAINLCAQIRPPSENEGRKRNAASRPAFYITTSTGFNNNTGAFGMSFDVPVSKDISVDAGAGIGSWGSKLYAGGKYYLKPDHRGFAFGTGVTYCPGVHQQHTKLETVYGTNEDVIYNGHSQANILFAAYRYWNLGKKYNRVYMELGWSVPLSSGSKFTQIAGPPLSARSVDILNTLSPGGIIIAVGFSFGVH